MKIIKMIVASILFWLWLPLLAMAYPLNLIIGILKVTIDHLTEPKKKLWDYIR